MFVENTTEFEASNLLTDEKSSIRVVDAKSEEVGYKTGQILKFNADTGKFEKATKTDEAVAVVYDGAGTDGKVVAVLSGGVRFNMLTVLDGENEVAFKDLAVAEQGAIKNALLDRSIVIENID